MVTGKDMETMRYKVQTAVGGGCWTDWEKPTKELPQGTVIRFLVDRAKPGALPDWVPDHDHLGHTVGMILKAFPANDAVQTIADGHEAVCTLRVSLPDVPDESSMAWIKKNASRFETEFDEQWKSGTPKAVRWDIPWRDDESKIMVFHTFLIIWTEWDKKGVAP